MLEFDVYEEVSEARAARRSVWKSSWLHSLESANSCRSRLVVNQVRWMFLLRHHHWQPWSSSYIEQHHERVDVLELWIVSVAFFHAAMEEDVSARTPMTMSKKRRPYGW